MKHIRSIFKWAVYVWAGITFVLVVVGGFVLWRQNASSDGPEIDKATTEDVRFVLNWCRLGDGRIERVTHSFISERSFTGDHTDAYAIKIQAVATSELTKAGTNFDGGWYRGDQASPVLRDAVRLATGFTHGSATAWFPSENEILTDRYYIWVWEIRLHGLYPAATQIIFVRPEDRMIFYVDVKT